MLISHGQRSFAIGLEWVTAHNAAEVRRESKKRPAAHRAVRPAGGKFWLGTYEGPVTGKPLAAALAVGRVEPNVIVSEQVSETHYWMCSIQDGLPVVGHDLLVPIAQARELAAEWTAGFGKSAFIGDMPGARCSVVTLLNSFDELVKAKTITGKELAGMRLQRQGIPVGTIAGIAAAAALVLASYPAWTYWKRMQATGAMQKLTMSQAAQQALNAEQLEKERKRKVAEFHQQVAAKRAELVAMQVNSPVPLWAAWRDIRRSLPVSVRGFAPGSMACDPQACKVEWSGSGAFTLPSDKQHLPGAESTLEPTLEASSRFPVQAAEMQRKVTHGFTTAEALRLSMASAARVSLPSLQLDRMEPVVVTPPPDLGLQPVTLGAIGRWKVGFDGATAPLQAEEAFVFLARWPITLTSLQFGSLQGQAPVGIEGTYVLVGEQ